MTTHPNAPAPTHIPSLDGWRAVAILVVFTSHMGLGHIVPGGLGVTIFFFLSGYLITTLLIQEHERTGRISIKHFYLRRAFRLMPPLVVTLFIAYTLTYAGITQGNVSLSGFASQLLYFANYYYLFFDTGSTTPAGTGIFWSLAVEEHFYFVFPFVFAAFFHKKGTAINATLIAVCILTLVWRCILVLALDSPASRTYYATDTRIDSIVFGCLMALMKNPLKNSSTQKQLLWRDWLILGCAISALLVTLIIRNSTFRETLRYSIQGIALAPIFYYSIRQHTHHIFRVLNTTFIEKIGKYSYSIYLIHYFIIENLITVQINSAAKIGITILLVIFYAAFIEKFVDKPFIQLRQKFR